MMSADYTSQHFVAVAFSALFTLLLTFVVISQSSLLGSSRGVILAAFVCIAIVTLSYRRSMHCWSQADNADRPSCSLAIVRPAVISARYVGKTDWATA